MKYQLSEDWKDIKEIIVYGAGRLSGDVLPLLKQYFKIKAVVDSDPSKWGGDLCGISINKPESVKDEVHNCKVIIATVRRNARDIATFLNSIGLSHNRDYCVLEDFISEWFYRFRNKVYLLEIHTAINTNCTLKCKNCNMFIPYYKDNLIETKAELERDLDLLFRHVDYLCNLKILGGEPLLNPDLSSMIDLIFKKYSDKIGSVGIITNGTVLPTEDTISYSKEHGVKFHISNYSDKVPYEERLNDFIRLLDENGIEYAVSKDLRWCDFGFPSNPRKIPENKVRQHMLDCGPIFHGLNDGKLYYCHIIWSAEKIGLWNTKNSDYVDLGENDENNGMKERILDHCNGSIDSERDYISLCSVCGGCGSDNDEFVPAALQVTRNEN